MSGGQGDPRFALPNPVTDSTNVPYFLLLTPLKTEPKAANMQKDPSDDAVYLSTTPGKPLWPGVRTRSCLLPVTERKLGGGARGGRDRGSK